MLGETPPGAPPIDMTIGEPRQGVPALLAPVLAANAAGWGSYPPISGTAELRAAIAGWAARRFGVALDENRQIMPLAGTREGLFSACFIACDRRRFSGRPVIAMPNPFYQAYLAGALAAGAEPLFLPATAATGNLPDLDAIPLAMLPRLAALFVNSPANPQGAVASVTYLARAIAIAREADAMLFADECYSELGFGTTPPPGVLAQAGPDFANVVAFHSLSKRSGVPGLRSGFAAGDAVFIAAFGAFRNVACPQTPLPIQAAAAALWADEAHVMQGRARYAASRAAAAALGFAVPPAGFFLWLDMAQLGGGEAAAKTIWKHCGVKVLPGAYLAQGQGAANPGADHIRLALVDGVDTAREGLARIAELLR